MKGDSILKPKNFAKLFILLLILLIFSTLVISCQRSKRPEPITNVDKIETETDGIQPQELSTIPDVVFLPPLGDSIELTGDFDDSVSVTIEIFDLVDGQAVGSPIGPTLSTADGSIQINYDLGIEEKYHANWDITDSNKDDGAIVRIELRLNNAPSDIPACNAGADANIGCIGYFDVQLWKNQGQVKKNDGDQDDLIDLTNGQTLPIKFHIKEGAANVSPIVDITSPENNTRFTANDEITFTATANDLEDGDLSAQVTWISNITGELATEAAATIATQLPLGTHVITAFVTDSNGATSTSSITVEILSPVPTPWQSVDIGSTGISSYDSETEIFDLETNPTGDPSTQYAYQEIASDAPDFFAEACLQSLVSNDPNAKAGLLLLQDATTIAAPYLYAYFSQAGTKVEYQTKTVTQVEGTEGTEEVVEISEIQEISGQLSEIGETSICFRIEKVADEVRVYESTDKTNWQLLATVNLTLDPVLIGLATTALTSTVQALFNSVTIEPYAPPQAVFTTTSTSGEVPLAVEFDASGSTGTDLSYTWNFGNGESATGQQVSYTFQDIGEYEVTLTVSDATRKSIESTTIEGLVSTTLLVDGSAQCDLAVTGGLFNTNLALQDGDGNFLDNPLAVEDISFADVQVLSVDTQEVLANGTLTANAILTQTTNSSAASIIIIFDQSDSVLNFDSQNLRIQAAKNLIEQLRPNDEVAIAVQGGVKVLSFLQGFTNDKQALFAALDSLRWGTSHIYSPLITAAEHLKTANNPIKAVIQITDAIAVDTIYFSEAIAALKQEGVYAFPIGIEAPYPYDVYQYLRWTACETGGIFSKANQPEALDEIFATIESRLTTNGTNLETTLSFETPLPSQGTYILSGTAQVTVDSQIINTPFSITFDIEPAIPSAPVISDITPNQGPTTGGTQITFTGNNIHGPVEVFFGPYKSSPVFSSETKEYPSATVKLPKIDPANAGEVQAVLKTPFGISNPLPFTYYPEYKPEILQFTASTTSPRVGKEFTFNWQVRDLAGDTLNCRLYIAYGIEFHIEDCANTTSYAYTYPEVLSQKYAILYVSDGKFSINKSLRMYVQPPIPVPTIESLSVTSGAVAGGTEVTITGQNFTNASSVKFGDLEATFTLISSTEITTTSPARSEGTVGVTVTTPGGTSGPVDFTYIVIPPPALTSISPTEGSIEGGTVITITGTNLSDATGVDFGTTAAQSFTVVSDTEISATSPASGEGTVGIVVTTPSGTSDSIDFTYVLPVPVIDSISPTEGSIKGSTQVTITGSYFTSDAEVSFDGVLVTDFTVVSDTEITVTSPVHSEGTVGVTVTTANGTSNAVTFTYINNPPVINSFTASKTTVDIGEEVTFSWDVEDPDGHQMSCVLDFGSYRGYKFGVFETRDCDSVNSFTHSFFTSSSYILTLEVIDQGGLKNVKQITVDVSSSLGFDPFALVSFTEPEIQSVWTQVINRPDIARLNWQFDTQDQENSIALQNGGDISLIISEVGKPNMVMVMASEGEIFGLEVWSFDPETDTLHISNVLDARSIKIENISSPKFQSGLLTDEEFRSLVKQLEGLTNIDYLQSLFGWNDTQIQSSSNLQSLAIPRTPCRNCLPEASTLDLARAFLVVGAMSSAASEILVGARCLFLPTASQTLAYCVYNALGYLTTHMGKFYAMHAVVQASRALAGCLRANDPDLHLESGHIAWAAPAPFIIFVKDRVLDEVIYSKNVLQVTDENIIQTLEEAKFKAVETFEGLTGFGIQDRNGDKRVDLDDVEINESFFHIEADWSSQVDISKQCF